MKLNDYIQVVPTLPAVECEGLITSYHQHFDKHVKNDNTVQQFTELNYNQCASKEQMNQLVARIKNAVEWYTDVHCPTGSRFFPQKYGLEEFRIKCYNDEGDCFRQHVDVGDLNSSRRFLSFLFYLNDDYEGGTTVFRTPDKKIVQPMKGNCLMFPPTWQYPHEGKPVTCGTKYIMSTYLHYV
jgi:hypothetical protein